MRAHAHGERLQPALEQEAGVRVQATAEGEQARPDHVGELSAAERHAGDEVAVAVEVPGARVHDHVGAEFERPATERRDEGGVDHQPRAVRAPARRWPRCPTRAADWSSPRNFNSIVFGRSAAWILSGSRRADVAHREAERRQLVMEQVVGAAVRFVGGDDVPPPCRSASAVAEIAAMPLAKTSRLGALERGELFLHRPLARLP